MKYSKTLNIVLFCVISFVFVYVVYKADKLLPEKKVINVTIKGANYLSEKDYLEYAYLNYPEFYDFLNLKVVKDRLEKHPYIKNATARIDKNGNIIAEIIERNFIGEIKIGKASYLIDDEKRLHKKIKDSKEFKFPLVYGLESEGLKDQKEVDIIYRILMASKILGESFYKDISKIDFISENRIEISLKKLEASAYISFVYSYEDSLFNLYVFWKEFRKTENSKISYVDARYRNKIFLAMK